jgi:regulator of replication initiation timing
LSQLAKSGDENASGAVSELQKLLDDERSERIQAQTLLSDYEAEFAEQIYQMTQQVQALQAEIDRLVGSNAELTQCNSQLAQMLESEKEKNSSVLTSSQIEIQALNVTLSELRMSSESLRKIYDNIVIEKGHLLNLNDSLSAELSHLKGEKAALLATFESLSDELVLVSKTQPQQVRSRDLDPLDRSLADLISSPLPESGSPQAPPGMC